MVNSLLTLMPPHIKSLMFVLWVRLIKATLGTLATTTTWYLGSRLPTCVVVMTLPELRLAYMLTSTTLGCLSSVILRVLEVLVTVVMMATLGRLLMECVRSLCRTVRLLITRM